jgi:hypothetical protein
LEELPESDISIGWAENDILKKALVTLFYHLRESSLASISADERHDLLTMELLTMEIYVH